VIEDTQLTLDAAHESTAASDGSRYLLLYGALQGLFIQQAALKHLVEALGLTVPPIPQSVLATIRDIRNDSIGHPTKSISGQRRSYHFISRPFLRSDSFQILSFDSSGRQQVRDVQLHDLIRNQNEEIIHYLTKVATDLMAEDKQHRRKFAEERLRAFFLDTIGYYFEKVADARRRVEMRPLGKGCLDLIEKPLIELRAALEARDEWESADSIQFVFESIAWPLQQLKSLYAIDNRAFMSDEEHLAEVCLFFVEKQIRDLMVLIQEMDESYANARKLY
jgi:hypothetical protein